MTRLKASVHAPREGSDTHAPDALRYMCISIHVPREGSDATPAA